MSLIWAALMHPVNDITTSFNLVPQFSYIQTLEEHRGKSLTYPEAFRSKQQQLYPDLTPLKSALGAAETFQQVVQLSQEQKGWKVVHTQPEIFHLEAVATTAVLRFSDDIVLEVRATPNESYPSEVHMRSRSRVGRSDLGANYKRIVNFFVQLKTKIAN